MGLTPSKVANSNTYDSRVVLARAYAGASADSSEEGYLDLDQERAKLAHEQAEIARIKKRKLLGELIDAGEVEREWKLIFGSCKTKWLSAPTSIAQVLDIPEQEKRRVENALKRLVRELLEDLAGAGDTLDFNPFEGMNDDRG